jgi:GTP-binding protein YchF
MEFGILGLELAGKSTLFALLTGHTASSHSKREPHRGVAQVPDPRLDRLTELFKPRKKVPAAVQFVDVPALVRGGSQGLNLPELRTMDGLAVVVRGYASDAIPHPEGNVDPARDLELIETELLLADLEVASNRLERLARELMKRRSPELELEQAVLQRCQQALEQGMPLRDVELPATQARTLKGFTFFTLKPLLVVLNCGDDEASDLGGAIRRAGLAPLLQRPLVNVCAVCATLEEEIAQLGTADQGAFLADLGLPDRALDRLLRAAYHLLGLISFLTVGEDECRAWSIPAGTPAVRAAGAIHTDLEKGFIRAEVVPWDELLAAGSLAACRQRGTMRLEGRDYVVADGDVMTVRFNL